MARIESFTPQAIEGTVLDVVVKAAVDARCPVIPLAIRGTREILPAYEWLLWPGPITISIGTPIRPEDGGWKEMVRLRDAARADIARRL